MSRRDIEFAIATGGMDEPPQFPVQHSNDMPPVQHRFGRDIRTYMAAAVPATAEPGSWTTKPEVPSPEEILALDVDPDSEEAVDLFPNNIDGPWPSPEQYLRTHYELLREDAVAPLRDAVAYVRQNPRMRDSHDLCVYEKVYVKGLTCATAGVAARIQFSTKRAGKKIVWEYSKRLISGNVVALTPADDGFSSKCVVAVVAARPLDALKDNIAPEIDLYFARPEDADFDPQKEWLMVEAKSGYYEAHRHTMTALQKMASESFPLSEYVCGLKPKIEQPIYLEEGPGFNLSVLHREDDAAGQVDILAHWPSSPENLDSSQSDALRQILTKKLAVIQGPPGTGKTYVSVVGLKTLLSNMQPSDPPIIVAAQTNHALDQLLRHVSKFESQYVRVGGRSSDLEIKKRTLFELARSAVFRSRNPSGPGRRQMKKLREKLEAVIEPLKVDNADSPLQASLFFRLGLITQEQLISLLNGAEGWVHNGDQRDPISVWLGDDLARFEIVYKSENFGFVEEEIDLEYEQLKELEAEQGLDDDDDDVEGLKGEYFHLKEGFRGKKQSTLSKQRAEDTYLKSQDMWKIPTVARSAVYGLLQKRAKQKILELVRSILREYDVAANKIKAERWERQCVILQSANIVGMTTTGLSKYRALVSAIKPKVILIEEAAEVIEAPVAAACVDSLQHLILVGDHQQLQGQCAVQELEGPPFNLNVSMFERLVRNDVEFKRLCKQRRMNPEIRQLLNPIYSDLEDHPSVLGRPGVPGMGGLNSFFFCHTWPESSDSLMSRYNESEAKMVAGFYHYLCMNDVETKDITVLTFYNGQRKKILKLLKENPYLQGQYVKVVTVDSYQGEENEIVLLSLVRSNETGNIGFLEVENRVCVALSRAKRGFYIFGDGEAISIVSDLWFNVCKKMREATKRIGYFLPLTCSSHNNLTLAQDAEIFEKLDGGCLTQCGQKLSCGHNCPRLCHGFDHSKIRCDQPCTRSLCCGHKCTELCYQDCKCVCGEESAHMMPPIEHLQSHIFSREITSEAEHHVFIERNGITIEEEKHFKAEEHHAFVERYREYANGGVTKEDRRIADAAGQRAIQEQSLMKTDNESFEGLFGRHTIDDAGPAGPVTRASARATVKNLDVTTIADDSLDGPARRKYTQLYTPGGHTRTISDTAGNAAGNVAGNVAGNGGNRGKRPGRKPATINLLDLD